MGLNFGVGQLLRVRAGQMLRLVATLPLLAVAMGAQQASAPDPSAPAFTIVLSGEQAPYKAAAASAAETLKAFPNSVRTVPLTELTNERLAKADAKDVFVAVGTEAAVRLHKALPASARLVYCMAGGIEVKELTSGHASTRGVTTDIPVAEQIKTLAEALPDARRLGVLYRASNARSQALLDALKGAAPTGYRVEAVDLDAQPSFAEAVKQLLSKQPDVIWTAPDSSVFSATNVQALLKDSLSAKVPVFGFSAQFVRAGAIVGVSVRPEDQGKRAGEMARDAANTGSAGSAPPTGPIQEGPRVRVGINMLVAERLGVSLAAGLVKRADDTFGQ